MRAAGDAFAVTLPIDRERAGVATPMRGASRCHSASDEASISLALLRGIRKWSTGAAVVRGPAAVEDVTDDRDRRLGAELLHHVGHGDGALEPLLSRPAQKFQNVNVASVSPCNAFSKSSGGAP